ncbi:hypothetical protein BpHYR1_054520 [Brachionus plicatilis]|uniref:Uncharacterized protein n=1 Tax=Brachionus plicatilis TaxID=10195 RepID=A0A3M7S2W2_BRAPC|nr:hypothetical protein BpHYR1_054520 [Brachionus plicatilis]
MKRLVIEILDNTLFQKPLEYDLKIFQILYLSNWSSYLKKRIIYRVYLSECVCYENLIYRLIKSIINVKVTCKGQRNEVYARIILKSQQIKNFIINLLIEFRVPEAAAALNSSKLILPSPFESIVLK